MERGALNKSAPFLSMLKIYAVPISLYCAKLRIVLRHKQLEWQEVAPPGGYGSEQYRQLIPGGNLPAMDDDGLIISDSEAIGEYLNEKHPDPDMLPGDAAERAGLRNLSRFHDTRLEPALRAVFPFIASTERTNEDVTRLWSVLINRVQQIEALLPDSPRALTLADCGVPITATWIEVLANHFERVPQNSTRFQTYLREVRRHQAVRAELEDYRPRLNAWLNNQ